MSIYIYISIYEYIILNNVYKVSRAMYIYVGVFRGCVCLELDQNEAPNYIIDLCCEQLKADGRALATNCPGHRL